MLLLWNETDGHTICGSILKILKSRPTDEGRRRESVTLRGIGVAFIIMCGYVLAATNTHLKWKLLSEFIYRFGVYLWHTKEMPGTSWEKKTTTTTGGSEPVSWTATTLSPLSLTLSKINRQEKKKKKKKKKIVDSFFFFLYLRDADRERNVFSPLVILV